MACKGLVIVGNDTEVGKTTVACELISCLMKTGAGVGAFKPAASGFGLDDPSSDYARLTAALQYTMAIEDVCPFRFEEPVAPVLAARNLDSSIDDSLIAARLSSLQKKFDYLVVETAGGLMSPLSEQQSNLQFAKSSGYPALVVIANRLGAINQANLICHALHSMSIEIIAVIFNEIEPNQDQKLLQSNADLFQEFYWNNFQRIAPKVLRLGYESPLLCAQVHEFFEVQSRPE